MNILLKRICDDFEPTVTFRIAKIDEESFAATSNDNMVRIYAIPTLSIMKQNSFQNYVYGIAYDLETKSLYVGKCPGFIEVVDLNLQHVSKKEIHQDLITQIIICVNKIISSSIDGTVKITNKNSWELLNTFNYHEPIWNIKLFQTDIYVPLSINSSVKIQNMEKEVMLKWSLNNVVETKSSSKKEKIGNSSNFNQLINLSNGEVTKTNCETIISFKGNLITVDQNILRFSGGKKDKRFKLQVIGQATIMDAVEFGDYLVLGLDNGKLVCLNFQK